MHYFLFLASCVVFAPRSLQCIGWKTEFPCCVVRERRDRVSDSEYFARVDKRCVCHRVNGGGGGVLMCAYVLSVFVPALMYVCLCERVCV
jgi:hypothetical protein